MHAAVGRTDRTNRLRSGSPENRGARGWVRRRRGGYTARQPEKSRARTRRPFSADAPRPAAPAKAATVPERANWLSHDEPFGIVVTRALPAASNLPLHRIVAPLADRGTSIRTGSSHCPALRVHGLNRRRERALFGAMGPRQDWTWRIVWLPGQTTDRGFRLYGITDIGSRKIVGWAGRHAKPVENSASQFERTLRRRHASRMRCPAHRQGQSHESGNEGALRLGVLQPPADEK
ncbi:hypothetical protein [Mangrovicoccus sp. HB161399]|uniref:hypothetical protein n=1 Tax=Mangrovicoccus sp. HB161399 TaxID=2720392 RepID=UPI0015562884|nr:hypothetical protein [Mangrovicoccus sp. HB161399]